MKMHIAILTLTIFTSSVFAVTDTEMEDFQQKNISLLNNRDEWKWHFSFHPSLEDVKRTALKYAKESPANANKLIQMIVKEHQPDQHTTVGLREPTREIISALLNPIEFPAGNEWRERTAIIFDILDRRFFDETIKRDAVRLFSSNDYIQAVIASRDINFMSALLTRFSEPVLPITAAEKVTNALIAQKDLFALDQLKIADKVRAIKYDGCYRSFNNLSDLPGSGCGYLEMSNDLVISAYQKDNAVTLNYCFNQIVDTAKNFKKMSIAQYDYGINQGYSVEIHTQRVVNFVEACAQVMDKANSDAKLALFKSVKSISESYISENIFPDDWVIENDSRPIDWKLHFKNYMQLISHERAPSLNEYMYILN